MSGDWISEDQAPGVRLALHVQERLVSTRTEYQDLEIVRTAAFGKTLLLDRRIMVTEQDEPFYHEMLVHPAMLAHPCPERIAVVGGGDGGALREVLRHPTVRRVTLVEIDREVVALSREHLREVHRGAWDDTRVQVVISPAEEALPRVRQAFDVLIVDSTDPVGPGEALFRRGFLAACRAALRSGGWAAFQGGSPFYHPDVLRGLVGDLRGLFQRVTPYVGFVPSYPSGLWAYVLATDEGEGVGEGVLQARFRERGLRTRYYIPRLGLAAMALPRFVAEHLGWEEEA